MSFFQDPIHTYNEENLVVSDHKLPEDLAADPETHFKTLQINGI